MALSYDGGYYSKALVEDTLRLNRLLSHLYGRVAVKSLLGLIANDSLRLVDFEAVRSLHRDGKLLLAIKNLRAQVPGMGLVEAKVLVEYMASIDEWSPAVLEIT